MSRFAGHMPPAIGGPGPALDFLKPAPWPWPCALQDDNEGICTGTPSPAASSAAVRSSSLRSACTQQQRVSLYVLIVCAEKLEAEGQV